MPPALDLYGAKTGNCLRTAVALEEAGLAYTPRPLDLRAGAQRAPGHLARNPRGKVPVLVVAPEVADDTGGGDHEGLVLTQSNAIQLWIDAQVPGVLLPRDGRARSIALERWLHIVTDIIAPNNTVFRLRRAGLSGEAATHLDGEATTALGEIERFLAEAAYLAGETVTLADIAAYPIAVHYQTALDWPRLPRLRRWFEAIGARPAVVRGMAAFG